MKKRFKVFFMISLTLLTLLLGTGNSFATNNTTSLDLNSMFGVADNFIKEGKTTINTGDGTTELNINEKEFKANSKKLFRVLFIIGVAATLIAGGFLGIKFMIVSAEEKAKIKEMLVPYIAGCIVIYGAFGIWRLTMLFLQGI